MRAALALLAAFIALSARAGALDDCKQKEKASDAVRNCVRAERVRSLNRLREVSVAAQQAIVQKSRESGRRLTQREYRASQAAHIRQRNATCRKQTSGIEQAACEADMNFTQVEKLSRFIE